MALDHSKDNLLHISWCDSRWAPVLSASNILDYFTERSNPFYSKDCNNEFLKMQQNTRIEQLQHMQGIEYILLHAQDPILYIVRKQHRYSPTQVNPLSCYHVIAGQVFQTPDLGSVINSRLISCINHINGSFSELQSFSQYHPSRGYWWQTPKQSQETADNQKKNNAEKKVSRKEEVASMFQRRRVDLLLTDIAAKFPYKAPVVQHSSPQQQSQPPPHAQIPQKQTQQQQQQQPQQNPAQQQATSQPQSQQQQQQQQPQSQQAQQLSQQQQAPQPQPQPQQPQPQTPQQQQQPPIQQGTPQQQQQQSQQQYMDAIKTEDIKPEPSKSDVKIEVKTEPKIESSVPPPSLPPPPQRVVKPPPEKRQKLG